MRGSASWAPPVTLARSASSFTTEHGTTWRLDPWSLLEFHVLRLAAAPKPRIHVDGS
jgi:hypothetical protein